MITETTTLYFKDYADKIPAPHYLDPDSPIVYTRQDKTESIKGICVFPAKDIKIAQRGHINYVSIVEFLQQIFVTLGAAWNAGRIRREAITQTKQKGYRISSDIYIPLEPDMSYEFTATLNITEDNKETWEFIISDENKRVFSKTTIKAVNE